MSETTAIIAAIREIEEGLDYNEHNGHDMPKSIARKALAILKAGQSGDLVTDLSMFQDRQTQLFKTLCDQAYLTAKEHGFYEDNDGEGEPFSGRIALMHSELSEALEEDRAGHAPEEMYFNEDKHMKPEGISVELADCIIRIFDWCGANDVDLWKAISLKMAYNAGRSYKHGKKY